MTSQARPLLSTSPMPAARDDDAVRTQPQVVLPIRPPPRSILSFPDNETDRGHQSSAAVFQAPQQVNDQGSRPPVQGQGEQQRQPPSGSTPNDEEISPQGEQQRQPPSGSTPNDEETSPPLSLEATLVQSVEATLLPTSQSNEPPREPINHTVYVAARVQDEGGCRRYKNYIFTAIVAGLATTIGVLIASGTFNRSTPPPAKLPEEPPPPKLLEKSCEPIVIEVFTDQFYRETWYEIKQTWNKKEIVYHSTTIDLQVDGESFFAADVDGTAVDTSVSGTLCLCDDGSEQCLCPGQVCLIGRSADELNQEVLNCEDGGGVAAIIYDTIEEDLWTPSGSGNIPAAFIRKADGEFLLNHSLGDDVLMTDDSTLHFKSKTLNSRPICLPEGDYEFSIHDHAGNGICCDGYYRVTSNGVTIVKGGEFGFNEATPFSLPALPDRV